MTGKRIRDLKGLGQRSEQQLALLGICSAEQFLARDPYRIYRDLKALVPTTSLNMLYAMIGAQQDRDWKVVKQDLKTTILLRLDEMGIAPK